MKLAIVHDHLIQIGGAEKVLCALQQIFPKAPIFTLLYDSRKTGHYFLNTKIYPSFLQKFPFSLKHYQWYLPLMSTATESYNLEEFDVVLSSCSAMAKGVITRPSTLHICYCHTPTRYLWTEAHQYVRELPHNFLIKKFIPFFLSRLRVWDYAAAQRVNKFVANSKTIQERIKNYYNRESDVIYPPVETSNFFISPKIENYYLIGGRLVAYKRYDLTVQAFNKLGLPLKIFGEGPEYSRLKKMAKKNIEFLGPITEEKKAKLYSQCIAFLHPQEEDFGITAVEAMASGRPVIAYAKGGALETIIEGVTGKFFKDQEWEALGDTIIRFKPENYNPQTIRQHALQFDIENFKEKTKNHIAKSWEEFQK